MREEVAHREEVLRRVTARMSFTTLGMQRQKRAFPLISDRQLGRLALSVLCRIDQFNWESFLSPFSANRALPVVEPSYCLGLALVTSDFSPSNYSGCSRFSPMRCRQTP